MELVAAVADVARQLCLTLPPFSDLQRYDSDKKPISLPDHTTRSKAKIRDMHRTSVIPEEIEQESSLKAKVC
jgi:hypothetical protein